MLSLQVNGIDLRNATHDEAINVLRQTPQKVRLTVYRDEAQYKEEDMYDVLNIELQKKPGKGLGLSIVGKRYVVSLGNQCLELAYHIFLWSDAQILWAWRPYILFLCLS